MFRTPVNTEPSPHKIKLDSAVLSTGSCFAQVIGKRLMENKFPILANPFGTLYNPASIFRLLYDSMNTYLPQEETYLIRHGIHFNYKFHSDFSAENRKALETQIEQALLSTHTFLKKAEWIIITLGTAYVYERLDNGHIVANCHKTPSAHFNKRLLSPEEIQTCFEQIYLAMNAFNERARFIFTVSPVRHIRDTLVQNSVSKASLRLAIEQIIQQHPDKTHYFPSYEIMMDDLRDYRFYKADMIHPNEVAEDYIWDQWVNAYMDDEAIEFMRQWKKIQKALEHRAFHPASEQHQRFILKTIEQLNHLHKKVDVSNELNALKKQLS
ncbi:GSCFA domain-containing protein [Catalinimonas niigatensis]|uniref:GSCFA domain-containing protein n=1 Tax=Catalinimonas niigatensis TaxID=1397264 RepID=UPI0026650D1C|nr:GSCFA domain-containing protein [Catalinimonas niigatensis]WPP52073.1 GSCFA domain-containing protein [Catalinimonas niigatensis]